MPVFAFAFSGAVAAVPGYGQRAKIRFGEGWVANESWTARFTATLSDNFTLGKGNIAGQTFAAGAKLRNRMYLGFGSNFALSQNGDVTAWEEQNPGAAVIPYLSQFGAQDSVVAFASIQGRLAVFGRLSVQLWGIDADPANFVLQQALDNTGTQAALSVKSIGDLDVLYLDGSGVRSLRAKETSLNAFVSDIGTPIDLTIRNALIGYDASAACGIVEPTTKQYWLFLNGTIYVLSHYPESKILAWSTYKPQTTSTIPSITGPTYTAIGEAGYNLTPGAAYYWTKGANDISFSDGQTTLTQSGGFVTAAATGTSTGIPLAAVTGVLTKVDNAFTPTKMVILNGQIYIKGSDRKIYRYGGSDNNTFDNSRAEVELPWLDFKEPSLRKQLEAIDAAFKGHWKVETSMNPRATTFVTAIDRGSQAAASMVDDSTFDVGRFAASGNGTHVKIKAASFTSSAAKLGKLNVIYKTSGVK